MISYFIAFFLGCRKIWNKFSENDTTVYAAQASFFIIIAFFPFVMLLLTLIQFIPTIGKTDVMRLLMKLLPDMLDPFVINIVNDLHIKSPGTILSVTALTSLWSASRGMMSIELAMNRIYGCSFRRNYILRRIVCILHTVVFMFACIACLALLVLGNSLQRLVVGHFPFTAHIAATIFNLGGLFSFVLLFICFVGIYTVLPWKKQNPWHQIPGAVFTVIGWMVFSYLFSLYFSNFSNYSYMYGSLTAIVLVMLWLYFCICILFLGAQVNYCCFSQPSRT